MNFLRVNIRTSAAAALLLVSHGHEALGQAGSDLSAQCLERPTRACLVRATMDRLRTDDAFEFEPYTAELAVALYRVGQVDLMWEVLEPITALPRQMNYSGFFEAFIGDAYFVAASELPAGIAEELLTRARASVRRIRSDDARAVMLSLIAHAYAIAGSFEEARKTYREATASVDESGIPEWYADPAEVWRVEVYSAIARKQLQDGQVDEAIATLAEFEGTEVPPFLQAEIAAAQMRRGEAEQADERFRDATASQQRSYGDADNVLERLAVARAAIGDIAEALEAAREIRSPETRGFTLRQIAVEQAAVGEDDGARETLSSFLDLARQVEDREGSSFSRRGQLLAAVADSYAAIGDYARSVAVTEEIEDPYYGTTALTNLAEAYLANERDSDAEAVLSQASAMAQRVEVSGRRDRLLKALAITTARAGDIPEALSLAGRIAYAQERALTWTHVAGQLSN